LLRGLLTTRGSAGHVLPRAPFGQACVRAGHEVRVVAQHQNRLNVERTGLAVSLFGDPASAVDAARVHRFAGDSSAAVPPPLTA
jgi:UDP:flavonoid glycosyltransferase YjiC (YdhE family)